MYVLAVVLAFLTEALVLAVSGFSPLQAYWTMLRGAFGSTNAVAEVLVKATPLALVGLGLAVAMQARIFNCGGEGQLHLGAAGAAFVGLFMGNLPPALAIPLSMLFGFVAGALWAGLAGWLKVRMRASEIIITLMMNYIAIEFVRFLVNGPWRDPASSEPFTAVIIPATWLPTVIPGTRLHMGVIIALLATVVIWFVLSRTVLGFRATLTGQSEAVAEASGISVSRIVITCMLISGGMAGIAGASELAGLHHRLLEEMSTGYGYLALVIVVLSRNRPWFVLASAFLFSALVVGADEMQRAVGVPVAAATILQGLVLLFFLTSGFLAKRLALRAQIGG